MSSRVSLNVREIRSLQFKDGSVYHGQCIIDPSTNVTLPYGQGRMETKEGFSIMGYFKDGKHHAEGIFKAPNGDTFYGNWNANHKRHGKGIFIRAHDQTQHVEEYDDGKLLKRVRRRPVSNSTLHWLPQPPTFTSSLTPPARSGHSLVSTHDQSLLVLFAGETLIDDGTGGMILNATNDVYLYDVQAKSWTHAQTSGIIPPPMYNHTATMLSNNKMVIIGGQLQGIEVSSAVYVLDLKTGVWSCPIPKGYPFSFHTASLIGTAKIWVLSHGSVFVLDCKKWEWIEQDTDARAIRGAPKSFIAHSATAVGEDIYVFGGKWLGGVQQNEGKKYERCTAELRVLHTNTLTWTQPPLSPPPVATHQATLSDFTGVVRGAWDVPRAEHTATLVGNLLYIIGGWTSSNPAMNVVDTSYLNDVQILDVARLEWLPAPNLPIFITPRSQHSVVQLGDELWTFGGRNSTDAALDEWRILNLPHADTTSSASSSDSSLPSGRAVATKPVIAVNTSAPVTRTSSTSPAITPTAASSVTSTSSSKSTQQQPTSSRPTVSNEPVVASTSTSSANPPIHRPTTASLADLAAARKTASGTGTTSSSVTSNHLPSSSSSSSSTVASSTSVTQSTPLNNAPLRGATPVGASPSRWSRPNAPAETIPQTVDDDEELISEASAGSGLILAAFKSHNFQ